jgi:hypothetical protein
MVFQLAARTCAVNIRRNGVRVPQQVKSFHSSVIIRQQQQHEKPLFSKEFLLILTV